MSENRELTQRPRRRGPMGRGMQPGEKPKDLKKSVSKSTSGCHCTPMMFFPSMASVIPSLALAVTLNPGATLSTA